MNLILDLKINQFYQYHQVNKLKHVIFLMIIDYQLNDIDVNVYKVNIFYGVNVDMEY